MRSVIHSILVLLLGFSLPGYAANCDSFFEKRGVETYPYMSEKRSHELALKLAKVYRKRKAEEHIKLDEDLTYVHAQREMTFQVKNPNTGFYDKFVDVPVNSRAVVIDNWHYDRLIQSTGPVMRSLRKVLQVIYSGAELNAKNLGLEQLKPDDQDLFLEVVRESIYLEPEMIDENMKDYPFLAVAGFDGAIGDPDNPDPRFFEMNLGTPSGLSNNILLLESALKLDKEFQETVGAHLPLDDTFKILKETIESNAKAWTGADGLSVVVSPGVFNGAHADVAAIANLTGMPMVSASDLFVDEEGDVRLFTSTGAHPKVTGIYGRMEESFFFQNGNVPMISPNNIEINERLARELGLDLKPAASYQYILDKEDKAVDIERDEYGKPLMAEIWNSLSPNPSGAGSPYGLVGAVKNKKLYYSGIGGRVVDDKRLFPLVSEYLVPESEKESVAKPVSSLDRSEFSKLYDDPKSYVVKEPNNSGGVGVYFLMEMKKEEINQLLAKVKSSPTEYEVQMIRGPNTLQSYNKDKRGRVVSTEVATDIRIFPMMDAEGNVTAGPNAVLFRTGPTNSFFSNTSKGGGYGIVAVTRGQPSDDFDYQYFGYNTPAPVRDELSLYQVNNFSNFMQELWEMMQILDKDADIEVLQVQLRNMSFGFRELMDMFPESVRHLPAILRYYADKPDLNWQDVGELENRLVKYLWEFYLIQGRLDSRIQPVSREFFKANESKLKENRNYGRKTDWKESIPEGMKIRRFETPERYNYIHNDDGSMTEKFDVAEILEVSNAEVQKYIDELQAAGGELRLPQEVRTDRLGNKIFDTALGGFWVNHSLSEQSSFMKPTISFDVTAEPGSVDEARALAVLAHEMEHFRFWKEKYDEFYDEIGMDKEEAIKAAYLFVDAEENIIVSERRAVDKEIEVEIREAERLGRKDLGRPIRFSQFDIVNRQLYPEFEAMRRHLIGMMDTRKSKEEQDQARWEAESLIVYQIVEAQKAKARAIAHLEENDSLFQRAVRKIMPKTSEKFWGRYDLESWRKTPLIDLITYPYGIERLFTEKTLPKFVELYTKALATLKTTDDLVSSRTVKALKKSGANLKDFSLGEEEQQQQQ